VYKKNITFIQYIIHTNVLIIKRSKIGDLLKEVMFKINASLWNVSAKNKQRVYSKKET